jgi:hypothetical protein
MKKLKCQTVAQFFSCKSSINRAKVCVELATEKKCKLEETLQNYLKMTDDYPSRGYLFCLQ